MCTSRCLKHILSVTVVSESSFLVFPGHVREFWPLCSVRSCSSPRCHSEVEFLRKQGKGWQENRQTVTDPSPTVTTDESMRTDPESNQCRRERSSAQFRWVRAGDLSTLGPGQKQGTLLYGPSTVSCTGSGAADVGRHRCKRCCFPHQAATTSGMHILDRTRWSHLLHRIPQYFYSYLCLEIWIARGSSLTPILSLRKK